MSEKLTEWFTAGTQPELTGVYQTKTAGVEDGGTTYQHWNGEFWGAWMPSPKAAKAEEKCESCRQKPEWRGLAENPEK